MSNEISPTFKDDPQIAQWANDQYLSAVVSRNRWFVFALASLGLSIVLGLALIFLMPLKKTEPYLIQVDKAGATTVLKPLKDENSSNLTQDEAVTKSFIVRYVVARETYDIQDFARNYDLVRLMSSSEEAGRFDDVVSEMNPASPVHLYSNTGRRTVKISSVSFLDRSKKTAQVRLTTYESIKDMPEKEEYWVAILTYRYVNSPMEESDRFQNPLGFQVLSYRLDQEIVR